MRGKNNASVLVAAGLIFALGCSDSVEKQLEEYCGKYLVTYCEKGFECFAPMAGLMFPGVTSAAECGSWAEKECQDNGGDPGGEPDQCEKDFPPPTEAQLDGCISAISGMTCTEAQSYLDGSSPTPAACAWTEVDPCASTPDSGPAPTPDSGPTPGQDGSGPVQDKGLPVDGYALQIDSAPQGKCPYSTTSFSCGAACNNLWDVMNSCASDPALPTELQAIFAVMKGLNKTKAVLACQTFCTTSPVNGSAALPAVWGCFQAVPTTCTEVVKCNQTLCPF